MHATALRASNNQATDVADCNTYNTQARGGAGVSSSPQLVADRHASQPMGTKPLQRSQSSPPISMRTSSAAPASQHGAPGLLARRVSDVTLKRPLLDSGDPTVTATKRMKAVQNQGNDVATSHQSSQGQVLATPSVVGMSTGKGGTVEDQRVTSSSCTGREAVGGKVGVIVDTMASRLPVRMPLHIQRLVTKPSACDQRAGVALFPEIGRIEGVGLTAAEAAFVSSGGKYPFSNNARCSRHLVADERPFGATDVHRAASGDLANNNALGCGVLQDGDRAIRHARESCDMLNAPYCDCSDDIDHRSEVGAGDDSVGLCSCGEGAGHVSREVDVSMAGSVAEDWHGPVAGRLPQGLADVHAQMAVAPHVYGFLSLLDYIAG